MYLADQNYAALIKEAVFEIEKLLKDYNAQSGLPL